VDANQIIEQLNTLVVPYGIKIIGAILTLIVGRLLAGMVRSLLVRQLRRREVDDAVCGFLGNMTFAVILVGTLIAAMGKFGVETASFIAVFGAASFAIGMALQGSLGNFAAGVMILVFRPFKIGDFVELAGIAGTVKEIRLFNTIVHTGDNVRIYVPNGKAYGDVIKNFSANPTRRVDLVVGIGYGAGIGAATDVLHSLFAADARIHQEPEPLVAVTELADSSVNLVVRVWVDASDYWPVKFALQKNLKEAFDQAGIEIPFPQQVIHKAV